MVKKSTQNHIIISNEFLHKTLKEPIDKILSNRSGRYISSGIIGAVSLVPGGMAGDAIDLVRQGSHGSSFFTQAGGDHTHAAFFLAPVTGILGGITRYKTVSSRVRKSNTLLEEKLKDLKSFDAKGVHKVSKYRKTHPFAFVDVSGNLHLVPANAFQNALASAQKSFLKEIVPGRYRIKT